MKSFKQFLMEEDDLRKDANDVDTTYGGFRVREPSQEEKDFLKTRPEVAGYYGNSTMNPDEETEGTIVINPSNPYMKDNPGAQRALQKVESVRGIYSLEPSLVDEAPDLSDEQDQKLAFYTKDNPGTEEEKRKIRKQTFYSRIVGGDQNQDKVDYNSINSDQWAHVREMSKRSEDKGYYGKIKAQRTESIPPNLA